MMYEDLVADFALRTRKNLHALESLEADGHEVYEVTQLINAMLGLPVFSREEFVKNITETPLTTLKTDGCPVTKARAGYSEARNLKELVRYLRNAIVHFNIESTGDRHDQICMLRVWNNNRHGKKTWKTDLGLEQLREIAERFTILLIEKSNIRYTVV